MLYSLLLMIKNHPVGFCFCGHILAKLSYQSSAIPLPANKHSFHQKIPVSRLQRQLSRMELLVAVEDYCLTKVVVTAAVAGVKINVVKGVSHDDLRKQDPAAKSLLLRTSSGVITQHVPMLRYIAEMTPAVQLMGVTSFDLALVDQWLDFSWFELEVPLQLLQVLRSDICTAAQAERTMYEEKAVADIACALKVAEKHLKSQTFFVGERLTVADITYFAVIGAIIDLSVLDIQSVFPALFRSYMTVGSHKIVSSIVGKLSASSQIAIPQNVQQARTESSKIDAGNFPGKWQRNRTRVKELLQKDTLMIGKEVTVQGWVRTSRFAENHNIMFVELTDGSTVRGMQLVLTLATTVGMDAVAKSGGVGASISVTGLVVASPAKGQSIEVHATTATVLGAVYGGDNGEIGGKNYPMAKKQHGLEFLREKAHLRPRSKMFSSAMRMRHAMAYATHKFFNDRGFVYTHTPLITAADCEGAGEQFVATTLLPDDAKVADIPVDKAGHVDFSKDFFGRRCCLTVSGQLNVETHACALSDVYTFGPTFRAENSHTARHLAEFWMIEPEICFAELVDDMALAEDYVRYCAAYALEHCADDLAYFENDYPLGEKGLRARLQNVVDSDFAQITYTAAVELLQKEIKEGSVKFERYPNWGDDLGSEHERYLCEKIYGRPTIVINYPKGIKAFYMKLNDDNETVAAMDILVPKIGELIGGSQREDKLEVLERRCVESGLKTSDIWWYADLRRYGSVPHAGFGLGFERLIMFVTGLENIRDVIPFPRVPGHADF